MSAAVRTPAAPPPRAAAAPGAYALERVEGWAEPEGTPRLQLRLYFRPGPGGAPGLPPGLGPASLRVRGPAGLLRVTEVAAPAPGQGWVVASAVAPGGAGTVVEGAYLLELSGVPGVDPGRSTGAFELASASAAGGARAPFGDALPPPPAIDYLAKDYSTFRAAMLDRMAVTLPWWTERNPSDIGVMLVELLAYAADGLSYYQDAAATEAYLGTARLRTSLSRHARLLDYRVNQGCSAAAWVQVRVSERGIVLPPGTRMYTGTAQDGTVLVPGTAAWAGAVREQPLAFETMEPLEPDPGLNDVAFYTGGTASYALAPGATSATLADAWVGPVRALAALRPGQVLVLQEEHGAGGGPPDPGHRQAVRLVDVYPRVAADGVPVVDVAWHADDALSFRLVVAGTAGGAPFTRGAVALGNLVLADHGETVGPWELPPVAARGPYRPYVPVAGVSRRAPFDARLARRTGASALALRDPGTAVGEVWLTDDEGRVWRGRADLLRSTPFSRDFVVEVDEEGASRLRFGDGALGMAPPPGTRFQLRCRVGLGVAGNVGRDVLAHLAAPRDPPVARRWAAGVLQVRNPLPAFGGAAPETVHEVRLRAPRAYQVQRRGVTPADWVALAEELPGVRRAGARAAWEGAGPQDHVWVQRRQGVPEDAAFLAGVRARLEPYRPAGRGLRVLPPRYVGVDVELRVRLHAHALRAAAGQALRAALGPKGVFSPAAFSFGEGVWLSRVVAAAAAVPGVAWVQPVRFARWDPYGDAEGTPDELPMGPHEVARMRDDPAAPWNGTLTLDLQGGIG